MHHSCYQLLGNVGMVLTACCLLIGTSAAPASANSVAIHRDRFGVAHVVGDSRRAVAYGFGYAIAQDRPLQMEGYRLRAMGTRAAVQGPGDGGRRILLDYRSRLLAGGPDLLKEKLAGLTDEHLAWMTAYASGITRYLDDHADSLPYTYKPEAWTAEHVAAICLSLGFESGDEGELKGVLALQHLVDRFGPDMGQKFYKDLCWQNDADVSAISHVEADRRGEYVEIPDRIWESLSSKTIRTMLDGNVALEQEAERLGLKLGSDAWAVGPARSATGHALLHGAPALGLRGVAPLYEIHLKGGGIDAAGVAFGGIPAVAIGHNSHIAWSVTSGNCDQIDLFIEEVDPVDPGRYRYKGEWRRMAEREERFEVKGGAVQTMTAYETVHGPVVAWDRSTNRAVARRRAGYGDLKGVVEAMFGIMEADDIADFEQAASKSPKSLNYILADDAGNIAHFHTGRQYVRAPGHTGLLPVPGAGEFESSETLPWEDMPHSVNPEGGYIAAANNQPGTGYGHPMYGGQWGPIDRAQAMAHSLSRNTSVTFEDLAGVTGVVTTFSTSAKALLGDLVRHLGHVEKERNREAVAYLRRWDFRTVEGDRRKPEAAIFGKWMSGIQAAAFAKPFGQLAREGLARPGHSMVYRLLKGGDSGLPLLVDYVAGASGASSLSEVVAQSLDRALDDLEAQFETPDMAAWSVLADVAPDDYRAEMPRSLRRGTFVFQVSVQPGFPGAESVLYPGNAEDPESSHHADQFPLYRERRFKPMFFTDQDIATNTESTVKLSIP